MPHAWGFQRSVSYPRSTDAPSGLVSESKLRPTSTLKLDRSPLRWHSVVPWGRTVFEGIANPFNAACSLSPRAPDSGAGSLRSWLVKVESKLPHRNISLSFDIPVGLS